MIPKLEVLFGDVYEVSLEQSLAPMRAHKLLLVAEAQSYLHQVDLGSS